MRPHDRAIAAIAAIASVALLATPLPSLPKRDSHSPNTAAYETTGSVGSKATGKETLRLSAEQCERIYRGLMEFPDASHRETRKPELADKIPSEQPLADFPENLTQEIPVLHARKFLKLEDRILLIDPISRVVVAMIPRYRVLQ
jgi:hypothetical protein